MYESFFRFTSRPFVAAPLASSYFAAESTEAARQTLTRSIDRAEGPGLIIGPTGTGKTLLCRVLADRFQESFQVAMLSSTRILTRKALLQNILFELGQDYRGLEEGELRLSLLDYLQPTDDCPNGILLIVDEAHSLPLRLLEEIRMITNLVRDGQPRVRLVMAGSSKLEEKFASPKLESFNQRVAARCYLESFSREETFDYVLSRVSAAGGNAESIFSDDALRSVYQATDGIPRLINQVCDHALVMAFAGGRQQIDGAGIEEAWADLQQLPGPWNEISAVESTETTIEFGQLDSELDEAPAVFELESNEYVPQTDEDYADVAIDDSASDASEDEVEPVVELPAPRLTVANPFGDDFDEEEVVIDQQVVKSTEIFANRTRVVSAEGRELVASVLPAEDEAQPEIEVHEAASSSSTEKVIAVEQPIACEAVVASSDDECDSVTPIVEELDPSELETGEHDLEDFAPVYANTASGAEMFEYTAFEPNDVSNLALETLCDVNIALGDLQADSQPRPDPSIERPTVKLMEHLATAQPEKSAEPRLAQSHSGDSDDDVQDDRSIILVENDAAPNPTGHPEGAVHRVEYQTLFAQLRQG